MLKHPTKEKTYVSLLFIPGVFGGEPIHFALKVPLQGIRHLQVKDVIL